MYKKVGLDDVAYKQFIEGFYSCSYKPGQRIDPAELTNEYQMSRTPIVHALKILANEKIVDIHGNGRFFIPVPTVGNIQDICHTRLLFEKEAIRYLVEKEDEERIVQLIEQAESCSFYMNKMDTTESVRRDLDFHRSLVQSTKNECMQELYEVVLNRFIGCKYVLTGQYRGHRRAVYRHIELMDNIRNGELQKAFSCIEYHILHSMELLIEAINGLRNID